MKGQQRGEEASRQQELDKNTKLAFESLLLLIRLKLVLTQVMLPLPLPLRLRLRLLLLLLLLLLLCLWRHCKLARVYLCLFVFSAKLFEGVWAASTSRPSEGLRFRRQAGCRSLCFMRLLG